METGSRDKLPDSKARDRIRATVSRETFGDLERYVELLMRWQHRINLIGPATVDQIWHRHIADSLEILPHAEPFMDGSRTVLADMGTGAGLPGIPLCLHMRANRSVFVHLMDSNSKKVAFLREAVRILDLEGTVHHSRVEVLYERFLEPEPQIVLARALAPLKDLTELASPWIERGATGLFLKGRHVEKELEETANADRFQYKSITLDPESGNSLVIVQNRDSNG